MVDDVDTVSEYDRCEFAWVVKTFPTAVAKARSSGSGGGGVSTERLGPLMYHEAESEKEDVSTVEMIHLV